MRLTIVDDAYADSVVESRACAPLGVEVLYRPVSREGALAVAAAGADGLLVRELALDASAIGALPPTVRVIGRYGVGVDNVDVDAAAAAGIAVVNVPDYGTEEVAQHAVALMLAAWRRLPTATASVAAGGWPDADDLGPIRPLSEATLGLVGFGRIGQELFRLVGDWFGRVVVHDPAPGSRLPPGVRRSGLAEVAAAADVLSLHCPLTSATHHLVGAELLGRMPTGSVLVNVSRGALVDTHALAAALQRGRPRLAAVDVLEQEPPDPGNPLVGNPRVVHTPHMAWYSTRSVQRLRSLLASRCAEYLLGRPVQSVVSPVGHAVAPAAREA